MASLDSAWNLLNPILWRQRGQTQAPDAYTDFKPSTSPSTDSSQLIKVSHSWIAFKHANGGAIGVLPVETVGRVGSDIQVLSAHGSGVSDWEFSPFDANQLITGSDQGEVKVWSISKDGDSVSFQLDLTIASGTGKAIETIAHHPTARGIIATASNNIVQIWDITGKEQGSTLSTASYTLTHPNVVSSVTWKADGTLLATTCKDTKIRVFDPRQQETPTQECLGHPGNRPSRAVWVGEKDLLFTVGFNKMREREFALWNTNDLNKPLDLKRMDSSNSLMIPLYDEDTSIMFLPSRGESIVRWVEVADAAPYLTEGVAFSSQGSVAGAALVPKQLMKVMQAEIARLLAVTPNGIWPLNFNVPRKSYLDFHADIFPDTKAPVAALEASEWLSGENREVPRVSLDPGMAGKPVWAQNATRQLPPAPLPASTVKPPTPAPAPTSAPTAVPAKASPPPSPLSTPSTPSQALAQGATPPVSSSPTVKEETKKEPVVTPPTSRSQPTLRQSPLRLGTQQASKFRFLTFKPYHVSEHFESISGLSISTLPECNLIEINHKFLALPLHGTGGRIGILKASEPGRVGKIPAIVCSSDLLGFKFDPFNPNLLVTASDDTKIKGWIIPEDGLNKEENDVTKPEWVLSAPTMDKISTIKFHPTARDVLLSASMDRDDPTLRLWNLKEKKAEVTIKGHKDAIFSCDFNHTGSKIVSVCRDKRIRVWDALSGKLLQEGPGHDSVRSCRVLWLGESDLVASVGFGRGSQREILLYDSRDLQQGPIDRKLMDMSPGVLVPHYDPDTSVLGVSARGDRVMKHFEILIQGTKEDVKGGKSLFVDVASLEQGTLQQDVAYLPKKYNNVQEIELSKMYRLTYNSVEVIRVCVPRNKKEYFQDDIFPVTDDVETPTLEASEFFAGKTVTALKKLDLCPSGMESLSHHVAMTPSTPQQGGNSLDKFLQGKQQVADDEKKRLAMERMFETAKESKADRDTLVPDTGIIDDDEWDD
ncbi:Coronin-7 [Haplosporangium bisporale]|nr:Coronin-7 [Haplosporangium bisporale]